ncbi:MAG: TIGR00341 family protein [bacterium]|nr:TIGR00341 family protein [bacterium]
MWFIGHHKESILVASRKEQSSAIQKLVDQESLGSGYYLALIIAICIVTPGLLIDNVSVIIGGMILAPLMIPLLALSMSLVAGSLQGFIRSIKVLVISIILTLSISALLTMVLSRAYNVVTWIPEEISPGVYIFIAFCSGTAGAFAWVKENLSASVAGVAIAVSLLPPLCAAGIGMALRQTSLVQNSLILFGANLVGICMAAFIVFWVLGFLDKGDMEEKVIENADKNT